MDPKLTENLATLQEKIPELHLNVDIDDVTVGDMLLLERSEDSAEAMATFVARFIADPESGEILPPEEALKIVSKIPLVRVRGLIQLIAEMLKEYAVNFTNSSSS